MKMGNWAIFFSAALFAGCGSMHSVAPEGNQVCMLLRAPDAASVALAASPGGYAPVPAARNEDGEWVVRMPAHLSFDYFYLVDGAAFTPPCRLTRPDGFGGTTCIYEP